MPKECQIINLLTPSPDIKREIKPNPPSSTLSTIETPTFNSFRNRWLKVSPIKPLNNLFNLSNEPHEEAEVTTATTDKIIILSSDPYVDSNNVSVPLPPIKSEQLGTVQPLKRTKVTTAHSVNSNIPGTDPHRLEKILPPPRTLELGRPPRVKSEALQEVCLLADDRLFIKHMNTLNPLQSQMNLGSCRLFSENVIIWKRRTWNDSDDVERATGFVLLLFDAQDVHVDIRSGSQFDIEVFLNKWKQTVPSCYSEIYFLIIGGKALTQRLTSEINKQFKKCVMEGSRLRLTPSKTLPTWSELEQTLWITSLKHKIHLQFLDKTEDLCSHLLEFSKCVAWEPYAHRHESHNFCTLATKRCGNTLTETWTKMLEEITRVTPSVSEAVASCYPSLNSLLLKYEDLSPESAALILSDIKVGKRTIGPAISRRIYKILTSMDGSSFAYL